MNPVSKPQIPPQYMNPTPQTAQIPAQYLRSSQIQQQPVQPSKPKRLFIRVKNTEVPEYTKALCLVEIFAGETEVMFYDMSTGKYNRLTSFGADLGSCLVRELREILGDENVVLK